MASKQVGGAGGSSYAGKVMELGELKELLAKFGMMGLDTSPEADTPLRPHLKSALLGLLLCGW